MVTTVVRRSCLAQAADERGFTLAELLVAAAVSMLTLGVAVTVASQFQRGYQTQLDAAATEEEARYAVEWIAGLVRSAGSNPYGIEVSVCPVVGTPFVAVRPDPNGDGVHNDIRINADLNPPNGLLGGAAGACNEAMEDVTIAYDAASRTITLRDNNLAVAPVAMTDNVIASLQFAYLDTNRAPTLDPDGIAFVVISVTSRRTTMNPQAGGFDTFTATSEVHVRSR